MQNYFAQSIPKHARHIDRLRARLRAACRQEAQADDRLEKARQAAINLEAIRDVRRQNVQLLRQAIEERRRVISSAITTADATGAEYKLPDGWTMPTPLE